jgi:PBP1b-binding outer membrane lipoprotein LpoB
LIHHPSHFASIALPLLLILFLAGCAGMPAAVEERPATVATSIPTVEPAPAAATATPESEVEPAADSTAEAEEATQDEITETEVQDWSHTASVDGDLYVLGNPAAPIRFIDYSDFL